MYIVQVLSTIKMVILSWSTKYYKTVLKHITWVNVLCYSPPLRLSSARWDDQSWVLGSDLQPVCHWTNVLMLFIGLVHSESSRLVDGPLALMGNRIILCGPVDWQTAADRAILPLIDSPLQGHSDARLHPVFHLFMKYWYWLSISSWTWGDSAWWKGERLVLETLEKGFVNWK